MKPGTPLPWRSSDSVVDAIISDAPVDGPPAATGHDDTDYYGGRLVCESVRRTDREYITHAANLHPRLLDTLRSAVRALEAVPEDVPGWMQRTHLCRRARELAKEAGETWAMGNGETLDSGISVSINAVLEPSWERLGSGGEDQ